MTDDLLELGRALLDAQPFSRLLGARLARFGDGEATLELAVTPDLLQQDGHVHGGVLSYLADNALTFAAGGAAGPAVLTSGFRIDYLRPARGETLRAEAVVVRAGRTRVVCRCEVYAVTDRAAVHCATAQGDVAVTR